MAPANTRVPTQPTAEEIAAALDRVQATHGEFLEHIEACYEAEHGRWLLCRECVWLDCEANAASWQYGQLADPLKRGRHLTLVR